MPNKNDQRLFELLSEKAYAHPDQERWHAMWDEILSLMDADKITHTGLIQTFSNLFENASRFEKFSLIYIMDDLIYVSKDRGGYGYPELYWIVLQSDILFESRDISDVGSVVGGFLARTGGADNFRSYLIHTLLTKDKSKHEQAYMAFYATGHTLDSLKMIIDIVPEPDERNEEIFLWVYGDALTFFLRNPKINLNAEDKATIRTFFAKGLSLKNHFIIEFCQQALSFLDNLANDPEVNT